MNPIVSQLLADARAAIAALVSAADAATTPTALTSLADDAIALGIDFVPASFRTEAAIFANALQGAAAIEAPVASAAVKAGLGIAQARIDAILGAPTSAPAAAPPGPSPHLFQEKS